MRATSMMMAIAVHGCGGTDSAGAPPGTASDSAVSDGTAVTDTRPSEVSADSGLADLCSQLPGPAVGTWKSLAPHAYPSGLLPLVWTGTELVMIGWSAMSRTVAAYAPATNTWREIPVGGAAPSPRNYPFVGWARGKVWLFGGQTGTGASATLHDDGATLDVGTGVWTALPAGAPKLTPEIGDHYRRVFEVGGRVLIVSATRPTGSNVVGAVFDATSNAWAPLQTTATIFGCESPVVFNEKVYCNGKGSFFAMEATAATSLPQPGASSFFVKFAHAATATRLIAWGGSNDITDGPTYLPYEWDPTGRTWSAGPKGAVARFEPLVAAVGEKVVIWGGNAHKPPKGTTPRADGAVYDAATRAWSQLTCEGSPTSGASPFWAASTDEIFVFNSAGFWSLKP